MRLGPKERRGSKPRCHQLTHGLASEVAVRLTELVSPFGQVTETDRWMPQGFDEIHEAQLHNAPRLVEPHVGEALMQWWLAAGTLRTRTPNWDIAATCSIQGRRGLLLVEAKAHETELSKESAGRRMTAGASEDRKANHEKIGAAISDACCGLAEASSSPWSISRDRHYQLSNRFAWAWKLADSGIPVILVYLGFLNANEMSDRGSPFPNHAEWERQVLAHSAPLFPGRVWNQPWDVNGCRLIPLIKSVLQPLEPALG